MLGEKLTFRQIVITAAAAFLCYEIHLANIPGNESMVENLIYGLVIIFMLPAARFTGDNMLKFISAWKGTSIPAGGG